MVSAAYLKSSASTRLDNVIETILDDPARKFKTNLKGSKYIKYDYVLANNLNIKIGAVKTANTITSTGSAIPPVYEVDMTYDLYDKLGNIQQTTNRDSISTSYVWGYGGKYPAAKLTNAKFQQVIDQDISGSDTNTTTAANSKPLKTQLAIRSPNTIIHTNNSDYHENIYIVASDSHRKCGQN